MKTLLTVLIGLLLIPNVSVAAELTHAQVSAIIGVLQAFGADRQAIMAVQAILEPTIAIPTKITNQTITTMDTITNCVEVPKLVLSLETTTDGEYVFVHPKAKYSTGCPIQAGVEYSYKITGGNPLWIGYRTDHGTIDKATEDWNDTEKIYKTWAYAPMGVYPQYPNSPIVFEMTVGATTEVISE